MEIREATLYAEKQEIRKKDKEWECIFAEGIKVILSWMRHVVWRVMAWDKM